MKKSISFSNKIELSILSLIFLFLVITLIPTSLLAGGTGGGGGAKKNVDVSTYPPLTYYGSKGGTGGDGNDRPTSWNGTPPTDGTNGEDGERVGAGGSAGAAGTSNGVNGGNASDLTGAGGGGGGGNVGSFLVGGNITSLITGGAGGNGGNGEEGVTPPVDVGGGGGGGGGGDGIIVTGDTTVAHSISGGKGGDGGNPGNGLSSLLDQVTVAGGGGGGGAGLVVNATNVTITNTSTGSITGGSGGVGLQAYGGGGAGVIFTANGTVNNNSGASITGGVGLVGGAGVIGFGSNVTINNQGSINGANSFYIDGIAGIGGAGISVGPNSVINNLGGIVTGGQSGSSIYLSYTDGANGGGGSGGASGSRPGSITSVGGAGITTTGGNVTVRTNGSIKAGEGGMFQVGVEAIKFSDDNNILELHNGFSFRGNVVCSGGTNNTLILAGTNPSTFDVTQLDDGSFQGFNSYQKKDPSTWTLLNATTAVTPWTLEEGILEINSNQALGDAAGQFEFAGSGASILKIGNDFAGALANPIHLQTNGFIDTQGKTVILGGAITGSGSLHKLGSGTLVLSGINTFTGGFLQDGTIALASNQGAGVGDLEFNVGGTVLQIANNLTNVTNPISLAQDGIINTNGYNAILTGPVTGTGGLTKNGEGTLELRNLSSPFSGNTSVNQGTLRVNGEMPNSAVTVANGALFSGNATVKSLTNTGTVKPGNSIGIIRTEEDYDNTNGTYACEVNSAGGSDFIDVRGTATLGGNVSVLPQPGSYVGGITYHILHAETARVGTFDTLMGAFPLLRYSLEYRGNDVYLTVIQDPFNNNIKAGNPGIVAQHLDQLGAPIVGSALKNFEDVIAGLSSAAIYEALNQLHPAANGLISSSLMGNEMNQMDSIPSLSFLDRDLKRIKRRLKTSDAEANQLSVRLAHASMGQSTRIKTGSEKTFRFSDLYKDGSSYAPSTPQNVHTTVGRTTLWLQQNGSHVDHKSNRDGSPTIGVAGIRASTADTSVGADRLVTETLRMGATVGYSKTTYHLREGYGKGSINSYRAGLYIEEEWAKDAYVKASMFYGYHDFKGKRKLTLMGVKYANRQTHHGYHLSGLAEIGRDFAVTKDITVTPYGSFGGLYLKEGGYREKEDGLNPGLTVHKHNKSFIQAKTGIQASRLFNVNETTFYIHGKLGYTYKKYLHQSQGIKASFTGYASAFRVFVHEKAQNMVNPGLGASVLLANNISLAANYSAELSSKLRAHQATLNLTYRFYMNG